MAEEAKFQQLRNEYAQMLQKIAEIETERREHTLVLGTLVKQAPERKCWRLLGGVLVEKTVGEIAPSLEQNINQMGQILETLTQSLNVKERELTEIEAKLGRKINPGEQKKQVQAAATAPGGVLV